MANIKNSFLKAALAGVGMSVLALVPAAHLKAQDNAPTDPATRIQNCLRPSMLFNNNGHEALRELEAGGGKISSTVIEQSYKVKSCLDNVSASLKR
jgi:hypothetical protein